MNQRWCRRTTRFFQPLLAVGSGQDCQQLFEVQRSLDPVCVHRFHVRPCGPSECGGLATGEVSLREVQQDIFR